MGFTNYNGTQKDWENPNISRIPYLNAVTKKDYFLLFFMYNMLDVVAEYNVILFWMHF